MNYRLEVVGYPDLPEAIEAGVIDIFREVLERRLGGCEGVLLHHAEFLKAESEINLSHSEAQAAAAFMVSQLHAQRAAFENLKPPPAAQICLVLV